MNLERTLVFSQDQIADAIAFKLGQLCFDDYIFDSIQLRADGRYDVSIKPKEVKQAGTSPPYKNKNAQMA